MVAIVSAEQADDLQVSWQSLTSGEGAAIIGQIKAGPSRIVLETEISGERILDDLEEDPLPRIC